MTEKCQNAMPEGHGTLLCLESSAARQALLRRIAEVHGLRFQGCRNECEISAALNRGQKFSVMVIAHSTAQGDSLQVVEAVRLSPLHATLPIAFLIGGRELSLARSAMSAGVTEVFLREEHEALVSFVGECAATTSDVNYGGKVLLLEDSESHASYVRHLCEALGMRVDVAADLASAERRYRENSYQLIIVDVVLKDTKSGISFVRDIRQNHESRLPILVMSSFDDVPRRIMAMKSGADDFISKPFTPEEFVWRARKIMERQASYDVARQIDKQGRAAAEDVLLSQLSRRETEIFEMIIAGKGDRAIASDLGISFWTVRGHIQQIFNKTGAINRRELMSRFIRASGRH